MHTLHLYSTLSLILVAKHLSRCFAPRRAEKFYYRGNSHLTTSKILVTFPTLGQVDIELQNFRWPLAFRISNYNALTLSCTVFIKIDPTIYEIFTILWNNFWKMRMAFSPRFAPALWKGGSLFSLYKSYPHRKRRIDFEQINRFDRRHAIKMLRPASIASLQRNCS